MGRTRPPYPRSSGGDRGAGPGRVGRRGPRRGSSGKRVGRLLPLEGLKGASRPKKWAHDEADEGRARPRIWWTGPLPSPGPDRLWVADTTYVPS